MQENQQDSKLNQGIQSVEEMKQKRLCLPQQRKIQSLIDRGWLFARQIMKDVTSNMYGSFVNLRDCKNAPQSAYTNRKPSKMTIQLIKQIHCGFEPLEMSAKRWFSQEEEQNKKQKQDVDQMLQNQQLINSESCQVKSLKKRKVKILDEKLEDPKQLQINLWEIGEDNISLSKKRLEKMQKEQKEKEQNKITNQTNSNQAKPNQKNKLQLNKQPESSIVITDQKKRFEQPQSIFSVIAQSKPLNQESSNQDKNIPSIKPEPPIPQSIDNKQKEATKDQPISQAKKVVNPFITPSSSKRLSILDLGGLKSDIFGNHSNNPIHNNNLVNIDSQNSNQSPFIPKNEGFQWSNNNDQNQPAKIELKPELFNNIQKTGPFNNHNTGAQFPSYPMQQGNPFSNNNPLNITKKGLITGQMTTSSIFKANQSFQKESPSKVGRQFSQTFNPGNISNQKVKAMFSKQQNTAVQPQSLFEPPSQQQNTQKKNKNNRRSKKDKYDRIN